MSNIERRTPGEVGDEVEENALENFLSLEPLEDDPYADISPPEALDDAFLALHSPGEMTPTEYARAQRFHSERLIGVLDSFTRREILETYRTEKPIPIGNHNSVLIQNREVSSAISARNDEDGLNRLSIDYGKKPSTSQRSWDYRIGMHFNSKHSYVVSPSPEDLYQRFKVTFMQPSQILPDTLPISQNWKVLFHDGLITSIEKSFNVQGNILEEEEATSTQGSPVGEIEKGEIDHSPLRPSRPFEH